MVFVKAKRGDSNDSVIRKFSRKIAEEGLMDQIRERQFHRTAAEIRKEKKAKRRKH